MPAYNWWEEATHGVGAHGHETTNVAFPITTAMSFNRSLWKATGALIGTEARALMNLGNGAGSDFWCDEKMKTRTTFLEPFLHFYIN